MRSSTLPPLQPPAFILGYNVADENCSRPHLAGSAGWCGWERVFFSPATTNTCCGELHFGRPSHQRFLSYTRHSFPLHTLTKHSSSPVSNFNHPCRRLNTHSAGEASWMDCNGPGKVSLGSLWSANWE
jgi:hypothetical protein